MLPRDLVAPTPCALSPLNDKEMMENSNEDVAAESGIGTLVGWAHRRDEMTCDASLADGHSEAGQLRIL